MKFQNHINLTSGILCMAGYYKSRYFG